MNTAPAPTAPRCFVTRGEELANPNAAEDKAPAVESPTGQLLLYGLDSLEYGAYCDFGDGWEEKLALLENAKQAARGNDDGLLFQVNGNLSGAILPKGFGMYSYVITTQFGQIRFAKEATADTYPNVWVKCSAEGLRSLTLDAVEAYFRAWIEALGGKVTVIRDKKTDRLQHHYRVNRLDLAADLQTDNPLSLDWLKTRKVARQTRGAHYTDGDRLEAYYVGDMRRSDVIMRIYDKIEQIRAEPEAGHIVDQWPNADEIRRELYGGQRRGRVHVWRVEFEIKKSVLREYGVVTLGDIKEKHQAIWRHLTEDWCSFREDTEGSRTHVSRRPVSPLWRTVQEASGTLEKASRRQPPSRPMNQTEIAKRGTSSLLAYVAAESLERLDKHLDFWDAWQAFGEEVLIQIGGIDQWWGKVTERKIAREQQYREWLDYRDASAPEATETEWLESEAALLTYRAERRQMRMEAEEARAREEEYY